MGVQFDRDFLETLRLIGYEKFDVEAKVRSLISRGSRILSAKDIASITELLRDLLEINRCINELDQKIGPL
jgi:hypothetical protein